LDVGPVALILLEGTLAVALRPNGSTVPTFVLVLALAITTGALLVRHRAPLVVFAVVLTITVALDYGPVVVLPMLLMVFTIAESQDRVIVVVAAAIAAAVLIIVAQPLQGNPESFTAVLSRLVAVGLAVALGLFVRARADYVDGLHERAARLERERELLARQAAGEERVRIARELHDVVAHNVSLMVVQAQALAATGRDREQQAALGRLAGLGREAMSEMHRMLGLLRLDNGDGAERAPQPGVHDLARLVVRSAEAGVDANLIVTGEPRALPPAVELSAFRIAQEALTNVIRHAAAEHVTVRLAYGSNDLLVTVTDDGGGPPHHANGDSGGHGLVGMRERVALFGGEFEAGARTDGNGYRVHASLPTG
jgi:signal transduction histidine kinase